CPALRRQWPRLAAQVPAGQAVGPAGAAVPAARRDRHHRRLGYPAHRRRHPELHLLRLLTPMRESRLDTLVLYADYITRLSYPDERLAARAGAPGFAVPALTIPDRNPHAAIAAKLRAADLTILLPSTNGAPTVYLEPILPLLQARRGLALSFVGNEVNL